MSLNNYHKVDSFCKNEGLHTDYFIVSNGIRVTKPKSLKDIFKWLRGKDSI
jgi:hypothetical protein